jgi:hypothetical protein
MKALAIGTVDFELPSCLSSEKSTGDVWGKVLEEENEVITIYLVVTDPGLAAPPAIQLGGPGPALVACGSCTPL